MGPTMPVFRTRVVQRLGVPETTRRERVVHSLDGLESPVRSVDLTDTGARLWLRTTEQLGPLGGLDYALGLDAGGILPTVAISIASDLPYKIAWKLQLPLDGAVRFHEPHAIRPDVYAYGIEPGHRMLLVDDEVTTGRTLADLTRGLRAAGAHPIAAVCLVEDIRHNARALLAELDLPLVSLATLEPPC